MAPATYLVIPCKIAVKGEKRSFFIMSKPKKGISIVIMYSFQIDAVFRNYKREREKRILPFSRE